MLAIDEHLRVLRYVRDQKDPCENIHRIQDNGTYDSTQTITHMGTWRVFALDGVVGSERYCQFTHLPVVHSSGRLEIMGPRIAEGQVTWHPVLASSAPKKWEWSRPRLLRGIIPANQRPMKINDSVWLVGDDYEKHAKSLQRRAAQHLPLVAPVAQHVGSFLFPKW